MTTQQEQNQKLFAFAIRADKPEGFNIKMFLCSHIVKAIDKDQAYGKVARIVAKKFPDGQHYVNIMFSVQEIDPNRPIEPKSE